MANLIIKPTSGGSLVLQDEGGDAALTVGTTGSITLAGTANNLGTITSGTTFPAGHIIQVVNHFSTTQGTTTTATGVTAVSGAITLSNATNKILALGSASIRLYKSSAQDTYGGISMECTSGTTVNYGPKDSNGWYNIRLDGAQASGAGNIGGNYSYQTLFEPDQSGAITVTMKAHSYPSVNTTLTVNQSSSPYTGRSELTLMEVVAT